MKTPAVSIIVPTHNAEHFITATIRSIQKQDFQDFEVIFVDDCSSDDTVAVIERNALGLRDWSLLRTKRPSNLPAVPRNLGVAHSRGQYLAFLDHDDLWTRNKLQRQIPAMVAQSGIALSHAVLWQFQDRNLLPGLLHFPTPLSRKTTYGNLLKGNLVQLSSAVVRRDVFEASDGFSEDPRLRAVEDFDLWLRISQHYAIGFIPEVLGWYRLHQSATSKTGMLSAYSQLEAVRKLRLQQGGRSTTNRIYRRIRCLPLRFSEAVLEGSLRQIFGISPRLIVSRED